MTTWQEYQEEVARFFRSLGFTSEVAKTIQGARGKHIIDVWVTGNVHGIALRWAVECKLWKTNIPKDKALTLMAIVQDIGADRGFLLSEVGFQSGTVRVVRDTNITLTSLDDLRAETKDSLSELSAAKLHWRLSGVQGRIWKLHKETNEFPFSKFTPLLGRIAFIDLALKDALRGEFPVIYAIEAPDGRLEAENWEQFIHGANGLLDNAEADIKTLSQT